MKPISLAILIGGLAAGAAAYGCEMEFSFAAAGTAPRVVKTGAVLEAKAGGTYELSLSYFEDHRNCLVEPGETKILIDGKPWNPGASEKGMLLLEAPRWTESPARTQSAVLRFSVSTPGTHVITIERVCPKGGYSGRITVKAV